MNKMNEPFKNKIISDEEIKEILESHECTAIHVRIHHSYLIAQGFTDFDAMELTKAYQNSLISPPSPDYRSKEYYERILSTFMLEEEVPGLAYEIALREGLLAVRNPEKIQFWVDTAIKDNPKAVELYKEKGKKSVKSFNFLMGKVMQMNQGSAHTPTVMRLLKDTLEDVES